MVHAVLVDFLARGPGHAGRLRRAVQRGGRRARSDIGGTTWTGAESDDALVASVAKAGNVILAAEASSEGLVDASQNVQPPLADIPSLLARWPLTGFAERRPLLTPPFPALARAARGIGHARLAYDPDGPARRYVPFVEVAGHVVPSLPVAAALAVRGVTSRPGVGVACRPDARRAFAFRGSSKWCPTTTGRRRQCGAAWCRSAGRRCAPICTPTFPSYSFQDVLPRRTAAAGRRDAPSRPGGVQGPDRRRRRHRRGPEGHLHHAVRRRQHARRRVPRQRPRRPALEPGHRAGARRGSACRSRCCRRWRSASSARWRRRGPRARPRSLAVGAARVVRHARPRHGAVAAARGAGAGLRARVRRRPGVEYFVEGREKRRVKRLFSRYVSKDVYQQVLANPDWPSSAASGAR